LTLRFDGVDRPASYSIKKSNYLIKDYHHISTDILQLKIGLDFRSYMIIISIYNHIRT